MAKKNKMYANDPQASRYQKPRPALTEREEELLRIYLRHKRQMQNRPNKKVLHDLERDMRLGKKKFTGKKAYKLLTEQGVPIRDIAPPFWKSKKQEEKEMKEEKRLEKRYGRIRGGISRDEKEA